MVSSVRTLIINGKYLSLGAIWIPMYAPPIKMAIESVDNIYCEKQRYIPNAVQ